VEALAGDAEAAGGLRAAAAVGVEGAADEQRLDGLAQECRGLQVGLDGLGLRISGLRPSGTQRGQSSQA
jgi:hypothetical protein